MNERLPSQLEWLQDAGEKQARETYEAAAPTYDLFTAHHEYEAWIDELLPPLKRHGLTKGHLLDVGCGTGKSFIPMLGRGWEVTACDASPSMLGLARKKTDDARLEVADLRRLSQLGEFDLVWALGDVLNNLLSMDDLLVGLQGMHQNLKPNGLLMFDLNTLRTYRTIFSQREITERDGMRMTWNGLASSDTLPNSVCTAEVRVEKADIDQGHEMHMHVQRHFPEDQILSALTSVGLECLDVLGQHQDSRGLQASVDEAVHAKAVYIAR